MPDSATLFFWANSILPDRVSSSGITRFNSLRENRLMRRIALGATLLAATAVLAGDKDKKGSKGPPAGYAWEEIYQTARLKAAEEGKLVFIDFYSDN
jgi:hypothetical protein